MVKKKNTKISKAEMIPAGSNHSVTPATARDVAEFSAERLITTAIEKNVPVETMERLLAMRDKIRSEQAKSAFDEAMSALQGEMPTIKKTKIVNDKFGKERYRYAPIDSIIDQTKEFISKNGFSYAITTEQSEVQGEVKAICTVKHKMGHAESSTFRVPIDKDSYMTAPQKVGAALTFAKRYAFCNAFGIITGDEDNDANDVDTAPQKVGATQIIMASEDQKKRIFVMGAQLGKDGDTTKEWVKTAFKLESFNELTQDQALRVIDNLQNKIKAQEPTDEDNGDAVKSVEEVFAAEQQNEEINSEPEPEITEQFKSDVLAKINEFGLNDYQRIRLLMKSTNRTTMPDNDIDWMKLDAYCDMMVEDTGLLADILETAKPANAVG